MPYSPYSDTTPLPGPSTSTAESNGTVAPGDISLLFDDSAVMASDEPGDHLDFSGSEDPELSHLLDLRRRAQHAERSARHLEDSTGSVEARSQRKRAKERCKEIDAILRLKYPSCQQSAHDDSHPAESSPPHRPKGSPRWNPAKKVASQNMNQLVAKMMLRRNERKGCAGKQGEMCSSKQRSVVGIKSPLSSTSDHRSERHREEEVEMLDEPPIEEGFARTLDCFI
jgi:hypothetical protein